MSPKDVPPDPRSAMTDRAQFMVRSLHTVRIVTKVALYLAKRDALTGATDAVRRACRFLDLPDDYDQDTDPTMAACIKQVKKALAR